MIKCAIISPCYNEEKIIEDSAYRLASTLESLKGKSIVSKDSYVMFVNDGSTDLTWSKIKALHSSNPMITGISLSHNCGHQVAIMAGMMEVRGNVDAVVTIDVDLQDDLNAIEEMVLMCQSGTEIVYGIKESRKVDPFLKRKSAQLFYKFQRSFGINVIENHADFRLLSKRALDVLAKFPERNLYLRGIVSSLGLKGEFIKEAINPRQEGSSRYTLRKMLHLASDGITSFSTKPMSIIFGVGLIMLFIAIVMLCYVLISFITGHYTPGWASLMLSMWFIGSIVLLAIGVVGIYVGKIYIEVKKRPLYIINESLVDCTKHNCCD